MAHTLASVRERRVRALARRSFAGQTEEHHDRTSEPEHVLDDQAFIDSLSIDDE
jgi:hypothetical protein